MHRKTSETATWNARALFHRGQHRFARKRDLVLGELRSFDVVLLQEVVFYRFELLVPLPEQVLTLLCFLLEVEHKPRAALLA